ncbi:MAG: PQQ-binding-like beta-propeller repeat protein [Phycisphaerales bacterium]
MAHPPVLERFRAAVGATAQRRLEEGDLERAWRSALPTSAGFDATLRLAQDALERGAFDAARRRLEDLADHPDFEGQRAARARTLAGLAAVAVGDRVGADAAIAALRDDGETVAKAGAAAIERLLAQLGAGGSLPRLVRGATPLDRGEGMPTGEAPWHLLAAQPLPQSLAMRAASLGDDANRFAPRNVDRFRERGSFLTAAPTVAGNSAFVNEGGVVRAYDRLSGRLRWLRELPGFDPSSESGPAGDLSIVAVEGDALVTLVGHANAVGRSGGSRVVCLDAATGDIRWQTALGQVRAGDESFEGLFPHGEPLIRDGVVYLLARKVTSRLETVAYVVALDLADGRMRWARHLCSSSTARIGSARSYSSLAAENGLLYAAVSTGAAACLDAETGEYRWLRRLVVPVRDPRYESEPWEMSAPLLTQAGIVMVSPDQMQMLVMDPVDGRTLRTRPLGQAEAWGLPRYFLRVPATGGAGTQVDAERPVDPAIARSAPGEPELIISIGSDIVAFAADDLARPRWKLSEMMAAEPDLMADERRGVRGRVQQVDRSLVVPLRDRLLVIDVDRGAARTLAAGAAAGNPLVIGPQLLLATDTRVEAYMPFAEAERFLRARIADDPRDADRPLALLGLGLRARSFATCIEAAEAALTVVEGAPEARTAAADRADLFALLLEVDAADIADPATADVDGERLHALMGRVASTPAQRARREIALGDWQTRRGRTDAAVATWRATLADPTLAGALVPDGEIERAAQLAVLVRLSAAGSGARGDGNLAVDTELRAALARNADSTTLLPLLERGVLDSTTVDATGRVCDALVADGHADTAMNVALRLWRRLELAESSGAVDAELRSRIAGLAVVAANRADAPARAAALLDAFASGGAAGRPADRAAAERIVLDGVAMSVDELRAQLAAFGAPLRPRTAKLGSFNGAARELPGRLLRTIAPGGIAPPALPPDRAVVAGEEGVKLLDAELNATWTIAVDDPDPRILAFDGRGLLLWSIVGGDPVAMMIDPEEGRLRWLSPRISTLLPPPSGVRAPEQLLPGGQPFDVAEVLPIVAGNRLILVRRSGEVAAIDIYDAGAVRWKKPAMLMQVHSAWSDDALLLLGGLDVDGRAAVVAIDARDGRELARRRPSLGSRVHWVSASPSGVALIGTDAGIEAFDPSAGSSAAPAAPDAAERDATLWRRADPAARGTLRAWNASPWMLLADATEELIAVRTADGRFGGEMAFDASTRGEPTSLRLRDVLVDARGVVAQFEQRIVAFDRRGAIVGMDAIADERDFRAVLPSWPRLVAASFVRSEQIEIEGGGRRTQYVFRIYQFDAAQGCKLIGNALQVASLGQAFERARLIDGWLLLSTSGSIVAVPLGASGAAPDAGRR